MTFDDQRYCNDKRESFMEYLDLPARSPVRLELALTLGPDAEREKELIGGRGWSVRDAWDVTGTPEQYRAYIQKSRGEFSCAKPSCMRLANAWISDRTLCYLASGKPAVVQHTGPSGVPARRRGIVPLPDSRRGRPGPPGGRVATTSATPRPRGRWPRPTSMPDASSVACWNAR